MVIITNDDMQINNGGEYKRTEICWNSMKAPEYWTKYYNTIK